MCLGIGAVIFFRFETLFSTTRDDVHVHRLMWCALVHYTQQLNGLSAIRVIHFYPVLAGKMPQEFEATARLYCYKLQSDLRVEIL